MAYRRWFLGLESEWRQAWQEQGHAVEFDPPDLYVWWRRSYENFNEFRLFEQHWRDLTGRSFIDIGCATGDLYRWLQDRHSEFHYHGYDISASAIERARKKYPEGAFDVIEADLSDLESREPPTVLWARDVVHHQVDPLEYLSRLLRVPSEAVVLRLRTRDVGDTVADPELSCQWAYGHWVPFIVSNFDELVETIYDIAPAAKISAVKSYAPLGGSLGRFLPKECYYPETGTAETAMYISLTAGAPNDRRLEVSALEDSPLPPPVWMRGLRLLTRRIARGRG